MYSVGTSRISALNFCIFYMEFFMLLYCFTSAISTLFSVFMLCMHLFQFELLMLIAMVYSEIGRLFGTVFNWHFPVVTHASGPRGSPRKIVRSLKQYFTRAMCRY